MKKIITLVLVVTLILSSVCVKAYSDAGLDNELEQKLAMVKSRIDNTENFTEFESNKINYNTATEYRFYWSNPETNQWLEVAINNEDIITYYYRSNESSVVDDPSFEYAETDVILNAAENLVYKLNPSLEGRLIFETDEYGDVYSGEYSVTLTRTENNIKVKNDTGSIIFSKNLKDIHSFRINYTADVKFESPDDTLTYEEAIKSFKNNLGYKLCYEIIREKGSLRSALKYVPAYNYSQYIDALTGEVFDYSEKDISVFEETADSLARGSTKQASNVAFTPAELIELQNIDALVSEKEIEKAIRDNIYLDVSPEAGLSYLSLSKKYYDKNSYVYYVNFEDDNEFCSVSCDAGDGHILSFSRYTDKDYKESDKLDSAKLEAVAEKIMYGIAGEYFTDDADNTFISDDKTSADGIINAKRVVNGIECLGDGLQITVNKTDGRLQSYSFNYSDIDFEDVTKAVSLESAYAHLFENSKYNMIYRTYSVGDNKYGKLIYDFDLYNIDIDAVSGKLCIENDVLQEITEYIDIEGHYAEGIINELRRFGIGFADGEFKPDEVIKQGEYIKLLAYVFDRRTTPIIYKTGNNYEDIYNQIKNYDWLDEDDINMDAPLTRQDACVILVNAMGYGKVASLSGIYNIAFNDVCEDIGYISILNALGVINGDGNGTFCPQKQLTRAEAAVILYNYINLN